MAHLALYRKYRSQTFGDLIGQEHVVRTLRNAVASNRIPHAFLFTGPRGTGKTSTARLLAKAVNCPNAVEGEPCGTCDICTSIAEGSALDVNEFDAASESGVDNVRTAIVEASEYRPAICAYKVFIIDEVHDLSSKAFDALLKTIEEPPGHVIFILATTEFSKVPPTIRSRCQRFDFHRGTLQDLTLRLQHVADQEGASYDLPALALIAKMADGGYRDALTLLEQAILTMEGKITLEHVHSQLGLVADETADGLLLAMVEGDIAKIIDLTEEVYRQGRDPRSILEALLHRLADLTRAVHGLDIPGTDSATQAGLRAASARLGPASIVAYRSALAEAHKAIRDISLPRLWLEAELVRIAQGPAAAAAAPAPVNIQATASSPMAAAAPAKAQPASQDEAPVRPAPRSDRPEDQLWSQVVQELSAISRTMGNRLPSSRVAAVQEGVVTIAFDRLPDYDWVSERSDVARAIQEKWSQATGGATRLAFVASGESLAASEPTERTAVELPLEGLRLAEAAKQVFSNDPS